MDIPALTRCHHSLRSSKPPKRIQTPRPYPFDPITIGDHLRKKRLDLGLLRKHVAARLNTSIDCTRNWENTWNEPDLGAMPKIIEFLGYCPYDSALPIYEKLVIWRKHCGLSQKAMARLVGIDPSTLGRLEKGAIRSSDMQMSYVSRVKEKLGEIL